MAPKAKKSAVKKTKSTAKPKAAVTRAPVTAKKPAVRKPEAVKSKAVKAADQVASSKSYPVLSVNGTLAGRIKMPDTLFAVKVNKSAIVQAVRVYLANQREGTASTKTRGEVEGSTRKIYRQKGTGRARHGAIRAPVFVGGGIVFGPKPRDYSLTMSQRMRRFALASALTVRFREGSVTVVDGLESLDKTKNMHNALVSLGRKTETALVVTDKNSGKLVRITRNIPGVSVTEAHNLNTYQVMANRKLIFTKNSIAELEEAYKV